MVSENVYSELCYDPNMMPNLSGAGSLSPKMTTGGYYIVPKGRESHIGHIAGTDSVLLVPSHMSAAKCDQLYRHHPQDGRTGSSSTSNDNVARRSAESHDPRTSGVLNDTQSTVTSQTGLRRHSECDVHPEDGDPCSERGDSEPESNVHQQPGVAASKKLERQEDIVERNKITLGRNTFPGGSYRMAYAHKQSRAHNGNKVRRQTPVLSGTLFCSVARLYFFILYFSCGGACFRVKICLQPPDRFHADKLWMRTKMKRHKTSQSSDGSRGQNQILFGVARRDTSVVSRAYFSGKRT